MFGVPVTTCVRAFFHFARKAAGAFRHPVLPAPSLIRKALRSRKTRARSRREIAICCALGCLTFSRRTAVLIIRVQHHASIAQCQFGHRLCIDLAHAGSGALLNGALRTTSVGVVGRLPPFAARRTLPAVNDLIRSVGGTAGSDDLMTASAGIRAFRRRTAGLVPDYPGRPALLESTPKMNRIDDGVHIAAPITGGSAKTSLSH
jgi:hypothetical protein